MTPLTALSRAPRDWWGSVMSAFMQRRWEREAARRHAERSDRLAHRTRPGANALALDQLQSDTNRKDPR